MSWSHIASRFVVNGVPQWPAAVAATAAVAIGVGGTVALNQGQPGGQPAPEHGGTPALQAEVQAPVTAGTPAAPGAPGAAAAPVVASATVGTRAPGGRASTSARVRPAPVLKAGVPATHVNYLTSDDGTLHTSVGLYSDCSGNLPLATESAALATCISGRRYFLGHNYGVFTPLIHMGAGAGITYWDSSAVAHHYRVVTVRDWTYSNGVPPVSQPNVAAQFQTCITPDGSVDRILDAVEDSPPAAAPAPVQASASAPSAPAPSAPAPVAAISPITSLVQPTTTSTTTALTSPLLGLLGRR